MNKKKPMMLYFCLGIVLGTYIGAVVAMWLNKSGKL